MNDTTFFASHRLPLAVAAREAGFEVALAALDTGRLDEIRAHGIAYHPLAVDRTGVNPVRDVRLFCQLSRLIRRVRPTLLHTVTIKPVIYGGIAARLCGVPSLVSAVSGLGLVFVDAGRKTSLVRLVVRALYRLALGHRNSCAIFQNPDDRQHMVDAGLVPGERTVLIRGSGVDVAVFRPSPPPPGRRADRRGGLASHRRPLSDREHYPATTRAARLLPSCGPTGHVTDALDAVTGLSRSVSGPLRHLVDRI